MKTLISRSVKDGSGATAIEYALIAAGIAGVIIAAVAGLGTELQNTFGSISSAMDPQAVATEAVAPEAASSGQHTRNRGRAEREGYDRSLDQDHHDYFDHFDR